MLDTLRSYLPLANPIGFGVGDGLIFTLAALLVASVLAWNYLERPARWLAQRSLWCMVLLGALPVILRLALLLTHPVPTPDTADDFSYLLLGDTLAHFRLANAVHPLHRFFETVFVLQEPSYASMFPPGQGIALALGQLVFGNPWAGVVVSVSAFCAACYWMLRGWTSPMWALAGGLLAVFEFGPLSQWMNSYWGGAVTASAGCLVFGSLPRLKRGWCKRDAALLGVGLGIHMLTRPFESALLLLCVIAYFLPMVRDRGVWRVLAKTAMVAVAAATPAVAVTLFHNHAVTGSWTKLPYALSQYQYGVPAAFTLQPNPEPHRPLTHEQAIDYQAHRIVHGEGADTIGAYFSRLVYRARFYRFFFFAPLYLALPFFLGAVGEFSFAWVLLSVAVFALGTNFYPYFYPHYIAALTCVFVLMAVTALERLSRWSSANGSLIGKEVVRTILCLCGAQFLFWYGVHALAGPQLLDTLTRYETWDFINYGDAQGRAAISQRVAYEPGPQLVFVSYAPRHLFDEWIHNAANIDASRVVFAADLGFAENEVLRRYYPDRTAWVLEPDARPPRLMPYPQTPPEPVPVGKPAEDVELPKTTVAPPQPRGMPNRIDPATIETVR